jgi:hypothetical protein
MQQQLRITKPLSERNIHTGSITGWLVGALCVVVFSVTLYVAMVPGAPGFSEFASMSAFP